MLRHPWLQARTFTASVIFFGISLLFFGRGKLRASTVPDTPVDQRFIAVHLSVLALFGLVNLYLLYYAVPDSGVALACLVVWYGALGLLPVTLAAALFSFRNLYLIFKGLGSAWGIAALCGLLTMFARNLLMLAWDAPSSPLGQAMQGATFRGVRGLLSLFYPNLISDSATAVLGTERFMVHIAGVCSGIEGFALMLGLTVGWLIYTRKELRLERSVLLVPISLLLILLLNVVRIAALVAIGSAGYEAIAVGGFHSEAGWILFSGVALGFLMLVNHVAWFRRAGSGVAVAGQAAGLSAASDIGRETNQAAVYLLPFMAILAASLLSQAISAGFEWFYGLRILAVLVVVYLYRRAYGAMDWRSDWTGPAAGVVVFGIWIGLAQWMGTGDSGSSLANGLARLTQGERVVWIAARAIAAVSIVPFAEELCFRGFVARRVMSADPESVSLRRLSLLAVLVSSLAFGIMHGHMWLAGTLAGVVFCLLARRTGRFGEAVAAHATANLLIAVWVLARGDYSLW
jgi:exosortase E/protease (VPEID-CTERM system)